MNGRLYASSTGSSSVRRNGGRPVGGLVVVLVEGLVLVLYVGIVVLFVCKIGSPPVCWTVCLVCKIGGRPVVKIILVIKDR